MFSNNDATDVKVFGRARNRGFKQFLKWTIPLKEAASLRWYFYRDPLRSLTLLSLNVLSEKS